LAEARKGKGVSAQASKFHPNTHVGEASVVSFINEKPGTSDIN